MLSGFTPRVGGGSAFFVRPHRTVVNCRVHISRPSRAIAAVFLFVIAGLGVFLWIVNFDVTFLAQAVYDNRPLYIRFIIPGRELEIPGRIGLLFVVVVPLVAFRVGLAFARSAFTAHKNDEA